MNRFSIKDIENITGIKAHTIRIWEQRYGILQPKRTATNIRFYDSEDLKLALRIALLNNYGFKISRIHEMKPEEMSSLISKIADPNFKLQLQVNELIECTLELDAINFEEKINAFVEKNGIEFTVEKLLFQYLEKIGIMWMMDRMEPAQEHMAANIVFRKIAAAADAIKPSRKGPAVLLFLPEGEIHDISLMYVFYLLRKARKNPIYIGSNTPLSELQRFSEGDKKVDYLYTHLTAVSQPAQVVRYLQKLAVALPEGTTCFVSGAILHITELPQSPNIQYLYTLTEVRNTIGALQGREVVA